MFPTPLPADPFISQYPQIPSRKYAVPGRQTSKINNVCLRNKYYYLLIHAVAQWLRCCATNRKVAASIPAGPSGRAV